MTIDGCSPPARRRLTAPVDAKCSAGCLPRHLAESLNYPECSACGPTCRLLDHCVDSCPDLCGTIPSPFSPFHIPSSSLQAQISKNGNNVISVKIASTTTTASRLLSCLLLIRRSCTLMRLSLPASRDDSIVIEARVLAAVFRFASLMIASKQARSAGTTCA